MKRKFSYAAAAACVLLVICCSPKVSSPVKSDAGKGVSSGTAAATPVTPAAPAADPVAIAAGHEVYDGKCGQCHKLFEISQFTEEEWGKIIPSMARKARLTDDEHDKLVTYILAKRRTTEVKKG